MKGDVAISLRVEEDDDGCDGDRVDLQLRKEFVLSQINHAKLNSNHPYFKRIPTGKQELIKKLYAQNEKWRYRPYFKKGMSNRLIAVANDYDYAWKLANCMMVRNPHTLALKYLRCGLDWFCPFCAYLKGQEILKKYAGAWREDFWQNLVFSLTDSVNLVDPEHDEMNTVWDTMLAVIRRLKDDACFNGYIAWIEIKIKSFWPQLLVVPHVHVLICGAVYLDDNQIKNIANQEWRNSGLNSTLNVYINPVQSESHFHNLLTYIKPIDLCGPYSSGFRQARMDGKLECFHQEVQEFFYALPMEAGVYQKRTTKRNIKRNIKRFRQFRERLTTRRRFLYGGNCHGSARNAIGVKKVIRQTMVHQNSIRARVAQAREDELANGI